MKYLLTFGSTHRALKGEEILKVAGLSFRLIPAPKALVRFCALVISIESDDLETIREALAEGGLKIKKIYREEGSDYVEV